MRAIAVGCAVAWVCVAAWWVVSPVSAQEVPKTLGSIERLDPALDALLDPNTPIEVLSGGHDWIEGPVWVKSGGYLLFSEIPRNQILKWEPGKGVSVFLEPSGYTGVTPFTGVEPGTNGLFVDPQGRLVMCCHGDRAIKRFEENGIQTYLAAHYKGKRLNSPNDLVIHPNGTIYFTDPPYGLPGRFEDPNREIDWCGVYSLSKEGQVALISKDIARPNGIALSPDEKTLYVGQSDGKAPTLTAFDVQEDGTATNPRVFFDASSLVGTLKGVPDGMVVDAEGNVWTTGPGGVLILSPQGKLLGRILTGQATSNCTFGEDGSTLFITADMYLCRVKTKSKGIGY